MTETIRVLIADDDPLVRDSLRALIETEPGMDAVGEAADGIEAVLKARSLQPDVILLDLRLPECDGLATCRTLQSHAPEIPVIILTSYQEEDYSVKALSVGAWGCLSKIASLEEIIGAARSVELGQRSSPHAGKLPVLPPHLTVPYI